MFLLVLIGKALGKGTFGKVKLAVHNLTGEKVSFIYMIIQGKYRLPLKFLKNQESKIRKILRG
jgi:serine/threonine protein kinase